MSTAVQLYMQFQLRNENRSNRYCLCHFCATSSPLMTWLRAVVRIEEGNKQPGTGLSPAHRDQASRLPVLSRRRQQLQEHRPIHNQHQQHPQQLQQVQPTTSLLQVEQLQLSVEHRPQEYRLEKHTRM